MKKESYMFQITEKEVEKADRLDVFFYNPEFMLNDKKLNLCKYKLEKFGNLIEFMTDGKHGGWNFVNKGILFIRNTNIKDNEIDLKDVKYISKEDHETIPRAHLQTGDLLFTSIGSVGVSAVVTKSIAGANMNQNLVRIVLNRDKVVPEYVSIFLNSELGRSQSERHSTGNIQKIINYPALKQFLIPLPPISIQNKIIKSINEINGKKRKNEKKILEIKKGLIEKFLNTTNLNLIKEIERKMYVSKIEDRFDPYFYNPKFTNNLKYITNSKNKIVKLSECGDIINESSFTENINYKYIQIQDINEETNEIVSYKIINKSNAPSRAKMIIKKGDILLPTLGGCLDSSAIVTKDYENQFASNGFAVIRINDASLRDFIFFYITTKFAKYQIEQKLSGAIMASISKKDIGDIIVPLPTKEKIKKFSILLEETRKRIKKINEDNEKTKMIIEKKVESFLLK